MSSPAKFGAEARYLHDPYCLSVLLAKEGYHARFQGCLDIGCLGMHRFVIENFAIHDIFYGIQFALLHLVKMREIETQSFSRNI